jgi:hypothetical protein
MVWMKFDNAELKEKPQEARFMVLFGIFFPQTAGQKHLKAVLIAQTLDRYTF